METTAPFNLNTALQLWMEQLGQSPQVKADDLKELESHVRDSVSQLQGKGLSSEESFLIATQRVGSPAKLEPEFAKVNRSPLNAIIHGLILTFFSVSCWFLWGILHLPRMTVFQSGRPLPAFTDFIVGCGSYWAIPPLLAAVYCVSVWLRRSKGSHSWTGFFATTMAALILFTLPTVIAVFLPVIDFISHSASK